MSRIRAWFEGVRRTLQEDRVFLSFLKHTGWLTGSSALIVAFSAVQGILSARILGVQVWGMLAIAMGFAEVTDRLLSFRMNEFVVKWVTQLRGDGSAKASSAFKYALAADVGSALLAFAIVELLAEWGAVTFAKNIQFAWVFRAVALILLFQAGQMSLLGILQVNRDFRTQGLIQAGAVAASAAGMLVVYLTHGGIVQVIAVLVSAAALNSVMLWAWSLRAANAVFAPGWIRMRVAPFDGLGREMTRFAILGNLRGTIQSVMADGDLLILGYFRNPTEVAYFKLAKSIVQIAALTNQPLVGASYPEFASAVATKSWAQFRSLMRRGSKVAAAWVVPVSLGLLLLARPAIATLYGPSFLPATPILALLLVGVAVDGTLFWTSAALLSLGEPGFVAGAAFWATVGKLGLALLLVPVGGGVALAALQSVGLVGINAASAWRTSVSLRIREALVDA